MSDSRISFTFEDTQDHCYRDIILILQQSFGWHKISYRKRSKLERKRSVHICMLYALVYIMAHRLYGTSINACIVACRQQVLSLC